MVTDSLIRGTCTQSYPAGSESLTWQGICKSVTAVTLYSQSGSKTSVVVTSVASLRTHSANCHAFWWQSHWPGTRGTSQTWTSEWRHLLQCVQLPHPLLWGYLSAREKKNWSCRERLRGIWTELHISCGWWTKMCKRKDHCLFSKIFINKAHSHIRQHKSYFTFLYHV